MLECKYLVIGSGQTGLMLAKELSKTNKKVILVEREKLGGNYLNKEEIPQEIFANLSEDFSGALHQFSDDKTVLKKLSQVRSEIPAKIKEKLKKTKSNLKADLSFKNLEILEGEATFNSESTVEVNSKKERHLINFEKCLLATGKEKLTKPDIEGIDKIPFMYQWSIPNEMEIPKTLMMIGFNKKNLEAADRFANLGIKVDIYEPGDKKSALQNIDGDALNYILKSYNKKNIDIFFKTQVTELKYSRKKITLISGKTKKYTADGFYTHLNTEFNGQILNLEKVNIDYSSRGVTVDGSNKTTSAKVYAFGEAADLKDSKVKLSQVRKFIEGEVKRGLQAKEGLINSVFSDNSIFYLKNKSILINSTSPLFSYNLSQEESEVKHGIATKTIILSDEYKDGFFKLNYNKSTQEVLGFVGCGFFAKIGIMTAGLVESKKSAKQVLEFVDSFRSQF